MDRNFLGPNEKNFCATILQVDLDSSTKDLFPKILPYYCRLAKLGVGGFRLVAWFVRWWLVSVRWQVVISGQEVWPSTHPVVGCL